MIILDDISKKAVLKMNEMFFRLSKYKETKNEKPENIHCPICGYYCLGKGGYFCINKPLMCKLENKNDKI